MDSAEVLPMRSVVTDFAKRFSEALLVPESPTPDFVTGPRGKGAATRYNVYRNNVTVGLIAALSSIYPAVERITGSDFFRAMARSHVRGTPPTSPLLFEYGRQFPEFIDHYEYAAEMPWLSDVARIERAWLDAYHAADAPHLEPEALRAVPPEQLGSAAFKPHPATRTISSDYPAVTIFAMNHRVAPVDRVENVPEDGLITRVDDEVVVRILRPGALAFFNALLGGESLAAAAAVGFTSYPEFDLSGAIGEMIAAGAFSHIELEISNVEHA